VELLIRNERVVDSLGLRDELNRVYFLDLHPIKKNSHKKLIDEGEKDDNRERRYRIKQNSL